MEVLSSSGEKIDMAGIAQSKDAYSVARAPKIGRLEALRKHLHARNGAETTNLCCSIADNVAHVCGLLSGFMLLLMGLIVFYEIVVRTMGYPTVWSFEISTILFLWGSLLGLNYALKEEAHVRVDILIQYVTGRTARILNFVYFAAGTVYCSILFWKGLDIAVTSFIRDEKTPSVLGTPLWITQVSIPVGVLLLFIHMTKDLLFPSETKQREKAERDTKVANGVALALTLAIGVATFAAIFLADVDKVYFFLVLAFSLIALLLIGMPVFITLGILGAYGLFLVMGAEIGLPQVPIVVWSSLESFVLLAVPLFIMTGHIFMNSGLSEDLFDLASKWLRHLPGGLAIAAVFACAFFAAITGSSAATAATIGLVSIPEMRKRGYDNNLVLGTLAAGGTLGILIPPSIPLIIYSMITSQSVGALFIAGVVPGVIISFLFCLYLFWIHKYGKSAVTVLEPASWSERFGQLRKGIWGLLAPVIILGGIYSGYFTPTEAAGVALVYSFIVWIAFYKRFSVRVFLDVVLDTVKTNSMLMIIVAGALIFGHLITLLRMPDQLVSAIIDPGGEILVNRYLVLIMINILLLFLGCFLEIISVMLITLPVLFPLIAKLGFDPIWFGIILTINMELAAITPPVGLNLYVIMGVAKDNLRNVVAGVVPFVVILMFSIVLFIAAPVLVTFLTK